MTPTSGSPNSPAARREGVIDPIDMRHARLNMDALMQTLRADAARD
jgi:hypothetical protein